MNSREFDGMLDDLVRQALYPFTEAEPPARVWRRVLRTVRSLRAGHPAPFPRWAGFISWMRGANVTDAPLFSTRSYYVDTSGRCPPAPLFWDIALKQMFDLRLAS